MKSYASFFVLIALATGAVTAAVRTQQSPPPVEDVLTIVDYYAPPPTLVEAVASVDAVARVRVIGRRFYETPARTVLTAYRVELLETLKNHGELVATFEVIRVGGEQTKNGVRRRYADGAFPDFRQGGEYVLFLSWSDSNEQFGVSFGPDGAYELTSTGRLDSHGQSVLARTLNGRPTSEALQRIRQPRTLCCSFSRKGVG